MREGFLGNSPEKKNSKKLAQNGYYWHAGPTRRAADKALAHVLFTMTRGAACHIVLCRHGETSHNARGALQGQLDTQLNDNGEQQAASLGAALCQRTFALPLAHVAYTSDLERCSSTARIALAALRKRFPLADGGEWQLKPEPRMRERLLGPFQDRTEGENRSEFPDLWAAFCSDKPVEGVEMTAEVRERARAALREIASRHLGETVLVFSHGGTIYGSICALTAMHRVPHIGNVSMSELRSGEGEWELIEAANNSHLDQLKAVRHENQSQLQASIGI